MNRNLLGNLHQINGRFALMVVLSFCVLGAKAQTVDCSGTYYIGSNNYTTPAHFPIQTIIYVQQKGGLFMCPMATSQALTTENKS